MVAVIGEVGSGKSSLLATAMKETIQLRGEIKIAGTLAYVEQ